MDWSSCGNSRPASKLGIESVVMVVESLLEGNLANAIWMQHLWTMLSCSAHVTGPKGRSRWNVFGMQHDPATMARHHGMADSRGLALFAVCFGRYDICILLYLH